MGPKMKKLLIAGLTSTLLLSSQVMAHDDDHNYAFSSDNCSVDLNYGVIVKGQNIRFLDKDNTYVQINDNKQLFVDGKQISLTAEQQNLVSEYASSINQQVPEIVNLALNAVDVAFSAISHVVTGVTGDDANSSDRLNEIMVKIKEKVHTRFNNDDGSYFLAQQNFDEFDSFMEDELEAEIEDLVSESIGDILIAVGSAINNEEGDFEQRMEAFGKRMERMGDDIELAVEGQAEQLEAQAEQLCANLKELDQLEMQLTDSVAELSRFDLINIGD